MSNKKLFTGEKVQRVEKINLLALPDFQTIHKRLIEVALFDYLHLHTPIVESNRMALVVLLQIITIPKEEAIEIVNTLLSNELEPTNFEWLLLYNQLELQSKWTKKRLKVRSVDLMKLPQVEHTIKPPIMSVEHLTLIVSKLIKVKHLKTDYSNLSIFLYKL